MIDASVLLIIALGVLVFGLFWITNDHIDDAKQEILDAIKNGKSEQ